MNELTRQGTSLKGITCVTDVWTYMKPDTLTQNTTTKTAKV